MLKWLIKAIAERFCLIPINIGYRSLHTGHQLEALETTLRLLETTLRLL